MTDTTNYVCKECAEHDRKNELAPLPGKTEIKKMVVLACPYCDGDIFEVSKQYPEGA